jgi:large subunit ribosomal protein L10
MKDKKQKQQDLTALHADLEKAKHVFLTGYEKMTVQQDFELRKAIRGAGGSYQVIKNNIAEKASEGTAAEDLMKNLAGMTSMAATEGDPVALAKALTTLRESSAEFHVQGRHGGRPGYRRYSDSGVGQPTFPRRSAGESPVPY